jgi:hypothetical protein
LRVVVAHRLIPLLAAVAVGAALLVPSAAADGDPASDYLITQPVFIPFDAHVSNSTSNELIALLATLKAKGYELRVAVISSAYDLGAIPILYRKPVEYAHFLGQELFYWYQHELLVVMPNGYGVYRHGAAPAADQRLVASFPPPGTTSGNALVAAASGVVRALAARRAIDLSHVKAAGSSSSTGSDRVAIGGAVAAALALAAGLVFLRRKLGARR